MWLPSSVRRDWKRARRRRSIGGWLVFALGIAWIIAAHWSTAEFALDKLPPVWPSLVAVWAAITSISAVWYQVALIVIGLSWVAFVASRPDGQGDPDPAPAAVAVPEPTVEPPSQQKTPDQVLLDFLGGQERTVKRFLDDATQVDYRLRWTSEVPPGVDPEYARMQKLAEGYREVERWVRTVSTHLRQHVACADRFFTAPPDGDTPITRLGCYATRLRTILADLDAIIESTRTK